MKIAVASSGQWLDSEVDPHTGRAHCFIVYDTQSEDFSVVENWRCTECVHWAGLRSASSLKETGAETLIVRNIGPNTYRSLSDAAISVYLTEEASVVKAIRRFREGKLSRARSYNCPGHAHLK